MNDSMMKGPSEVIDSPTSIELANQTAVGEKYGTRSDESDMDRMGKLQELRVCWKTPAGELPIYLQEISGNSSS